MIFGANVEKELKLEFAVQPNIAWNDLPKLLELKTDTPREQLLESTYFDTPDFLFRKHGASLRVRSVGGQLVQTLKSGGAPTGGLYDREEYETVVGTSEPNLGALQKSENIAR